MTASIVWFRRDLRLADNIALMTAVDDGVPIIPLFIYDVTDYEESSGGSASRWWLHHSLTALDASLQKLGSRLIVRKTDPKNQESVLSLLQSVIEETDASSVYWNRCVEPLMVKQESDIEASLRGKGLAVETFKSNLLFDPDQIRTKDNYPFKVFTPFWKNCLQHDPPDESLKAPSKLKSPSRWPESGKITDMKLLPELNWADGFARLWTPGEDGAKKQLEKFVMNSLDDYREGRDYPADEGTSRISPHLHFGEISPRQIWQEVVNTKERFDKNPKSNAPAESYMREIGWREFGQHLLVHFPKTVSEPLHEYYRKFPWRTGATAKKDLRAWQRGMTGYPIVDAGMRELRHTGWMHNRVRMIVASFLVKHLLLDWRDGAAWFWNTLLDADLGNNTLGWQWSAGSGADAAPYFRIFNPVIQGEKFDAAGNYVRKWVSEIAALPDKYLHTPWTAPKEILQKAGIKLGRDYPEPIVEHKFARDRALNAFKTVKK